MIFSCLISLQFLTYNQLIKHQNIFLKLSYNETRDNVRHFKMGLRMKEAQHNLRRLTSAGTLEQIAVLTVFCINGKTTRCRD